jgi:hypothetical protein
MIRAAGSQTVYHVAWLLQKERLSSNVIENSCESVGTYGLLQPEATQDSTPPGRAVSLCFWV